VLKGLSAGDTVIASGLMSVREGMNIEIKELTNNMNYGVNE
jgi:membrane fusion protein (multidrug efflux system)